MKKSWYNEVRHSCMRRGARRVWLFGARASNHQVDARSDLDYVVEGIPPQRLYRNREGARTRDGCGRGHCRYAYRAAAPSATHPSNPDPAATAARSRHGGLIGGIATPPIFHEEYTIAALRAGKPVYVEKPMATSVAACQRMADAATATNGKLSVAHYRRALPVFRRVKALIDDQAVGVVRTVRLSLMQPDNSALIAKTAI